jgi:regulator of CtrA degradation
MITNRFSSILYDNTYSETLGLLTKAEKFLKSYSLQRAQEPNEVRDMRINCEMTRVTARLTQIMAWLLAQKAFLAGEIALKEACSEKYLIKGDPFCLANSINGQEEHYPLPMRELLIDSLGLYRRIQALSQRMNQTVTFSSQNSKTLN